MAEITLEKTHALLEKITEYVMNELPRKDYVPTKKEVDEKFQKVDEKFQKVDEKFQKVYDAIWNLKEELDQKADKKDMEMEMLRDDLRQLLDGQDSMVNQLDIIRTEQYAFNAAFRRIEKRVEVLELEM